MKSENYRRTEKLLKEFVIYEKTLEIRNDEKIKKKVFSIKKAMDCLNNIERLIIEDFYINNLTMLEISEKVELTREYTSKVKTCSIRKMERVLFGGSDEDLVA